jgi:ABC-type antimicrobial peptide transport system permease subunit
MHCSIHGAPKIWEHEIDSTGEDSTLETEQITAECLMFVAVNGIVGLILGMAVAAFFTTFLPRD